MSQAERGLNAIFGRMEEMLERLDPEEAQSLFAAILTAVAIGTARLP
ncbi:MAG: hypothetical protein H0V16_02505 [Burkholderiaceae bacterium]|nr:hypothetical protein [Burkholderiaceae bacterium]